MNENTIQREPPAAALLELPEVLRPAAADALATLGGILHAEEDAEVRADALEWFRSMFVDALHAVGYDDTAAQVVAFRIIEIITAHFDQLAGRGRPPGPPH